MTKQNTSIDELFAAVLLRQGRPPMEMRFRILRQVWSHYHKHKGDGISHGTLASRCAHFSKGAIFDDCLMDLLNNGYMNWVETSRTVYYVMLPEGNLKINSLLNSAKEYDSV